MTSTKDKNPLDVRVDRFSRPNPDVHKAVLPDGTVVPGFHILAAETEDNTPTLMADVLSGLEYIPVDEDSLYIVKANIIANEGETADAFGSFNLAMIKNVNGVVELVDSVVEIGSFADTGAGAWTVAVEADDTNDGLKLTVTGENNKTINWEAQVYLEMAQEMPVPTAFPTPTPTPTPTP